MLNGIKIFLINKWLWLRGKNYRYGSIMYSIHHRSKNPKRVESSIKKEDIKNILNDCYKKD